MNSSEWPIAVRLVNLGEPMRGLDDVAAYPRVRLFVKDGEELIGSADLRNARRPVSAARLCDTVADHFGYRLSQRAVTEDLKRRAGVEEGSGPFLPSSVPVSVIVPTCGRVDDLRRCLASLVSQETARRVEIIVVDNRPVNESVAGVAAEFPSVRLIEERRPGLSYARNAGFLAATGEILVATDDDVVAPPRWLEKLVAPFARPEVAVATGNVLPLQLETESQVRFEAYGGLGKGFDRLEADAAWFARFRSAVPTWTLGATANAAFRVSALRDPAVGLMEPSLGAGMPTGCSEDTYLFYRVLKSGRTIVYEPSAFVWHRHRDGMAALRSQIYAYSKGHVAYHLLTLVRHRDGRALVRLGWSLPKAYARRIVDRLSGASDYPLSLVVLEVAGNLAGPWALWRSRRRVRRLGPGAVLESHAVSLESPLTENPAR
jgi:GT2 family glycosyltransferase